jgi:methyl-accepting chemotaxis protein
LRCGSDDEAVAVNSAKTSTRVVLSVLDEVKDGKEQQSMRGEDATQTSDVTGRDMDQTVRDMQSIYTTLRQALEQKLTMKTRKHARKISIFTDGSSFTTYPVPLVL